MSLNITRYICSLKFLKRIFKFVNQTAYICHQIYWIYRLVHFTKFNYHVHIFHMLLNFERTYTCQKFCQWLLVATGPVPSFISSLANPPLMIRSARCVKVPLTRNECFFVTYVTPVGTWPASSPPSPPSLLEYENVPCAPPLSPHPRVHHDTSASPPPS